MSKRWILASLTAFLPCLALGQGGQEHRCQQGDLQRRVVIFYETGVAVPCEVHYYKDTEAPGEQQVLWRALNESGYCEARANEFVAQLESWGWTCDVAPSPATEPEVVDDTEALAPPVGTQASP